MFWGVVLVRLGRQSRAKRGLGQGLWEELREILGNLRRGPPQRIWEKGIFELITSPKRLSPGRGLGWRMNELITSKGCLIDYLTGFRAGMEFLQFGRRVVGSRAGLFGCFIC